MSTTHTVQHPVIDSPNYLPEFDGSVTHGEIRLVTGERVAVFTSTLDGALVFQIDTESNGRRIRINLNDNTLFEGDPEEG